MACWRSTTSTILIGLSENIASAAVFREVNQSGVRRVAQSIRAKGWLPRAPPRVIMQGYICKGSVLSAAEAGTLTYSDEYPRPITRARARTRHRYEEREAGDNNRVDLEGEYTVAGEDAARGGDDTPVVSGVAARESFSQGNGRRTEVHCAL